MAKCGCKHQDHDYYYERQRRRRHLALFLIALLVIILIIAIVYVTAFKPRDTEVSIVSVQVSTPPTILTGGSTTTTATSTSTSTTTNTQLSYVNASLFYQVHIYNPNRATYHVFGSDAILYFYASSVGTLPIPGFDIAPRNSIDISFVLTGDFAPYSNTGTPYLLGDISSGILPLTSVVTVRGRVTTLNAFSHSGSSRAACSISLSLQSKSIQTYVCK